MNKNKSYKSNPKNNDDRDSNKNSSVQECNGHSINSFIRSCEDLSADETPRSKTYSQRVLITNEDYIAAQKVWNAGGWIIIYLKGIRDLDYCALDEMLEYIKEYMPYRTVEKYEYNSPGGGYYSSTTYNKEIMYIKEPPAEKKETYGRFLEEVLNALDSVHE